LMRGHQRRPTTRQLRLDGQRWSLRIIGRWLTLSLRHSGVSPNSYPPSGVSCGRYPPLEKCISHSVRCCNQHLGTCAVDHFLGNSVGAIGWQSGLVSSLCSRVPGRRGVFDTLLLSELLCLDLVSRFRPQVSCRRQDSYLVDSASSHMLVSKIKPCMSKYKQLYRETANGSLNQLSFI
jgi:hypothetical protein